MRKSKLISILKKNREWALDHYEKLISEDRLQDADAIEAEFNDWLNLDSDFANLDILHIKVSESK